MKQEIRHSLDSMREQFEVDLRSSIKAATLESSPYGYALMIGEDLEMAAPITVTNSESDLTDPNDNDLRYIPDEWAEWSYDHFDKFKSTYEKLFQEFSETHNVTDENFYYTEDAQEFMSHLYSIYLEAMKNVISEFPDIWYWVIWISDSDREIIKKSFLELNSGRSLKEAADYFEQYPKKMHGSSCD